MKYFVLWHDYDGSSVDEFDTHDAAENRINELHRLQALDRNGETFDCCIRGERLRIDTKEVAVVYVLTSLPSEHSFKKESA